MTTTDANRILEEKLLSWITDKLIEIEVAHKVGAEKRKHSKDGYRKVALELNRRSIPLTRKQVRNLMRKMKLTALQPKKNTSKNTGEHPVFGYLLKGKTIRHPNQAWSTDYSDNKVTDEVSIQ